jgi:hypothetical protein
MHPLEHKIPPPVVALIVAAAMWMNSISGPKLDLPFEVRVAAALVLAVVGVIRPVGASGLSEGTDDDQSPEATEDLRTRDDGHLPVVAQSDVRGLVCLLLAWAVYLQRSGRWPGPILFVFYINRFQIEPEERLLATFRRRIQVNTRPAYVAGCSPAARLAGIDLPRRELTLLPPAFRVGPDP